MDTNSIAALATSMTQISLASQLETAVLRKTLEAQRQAGQDMLALLPAGSANLPPHLGQNINTTA